MSSWMGAFKGAWRMGVRSAQPHFFLAKGVKYTKKNLFGINICKNFCVYDRLIIIDYKLTLCTSIIIYAN